MKTFRSNHPEDVKHMDTAQLRDRFLIEEVFQSGAVVMNYVQDDRLMIGGAIPEVSDLVLSGKTLGVREDAFSRREFGVINLGGAGRVECNGNSYDMGERDGLYIGAGNDSVTFSSNDTSNPARYYIASTPAHITYDTVHISFDQTFPVDLGEPSKSNVRTIHQYVHPKICKSAQLLMGMTLLADGSLWNTMPCHTHDRRMEVYFYFNMPSEERVFHFMGEVDETRHLVVGAEQAVIAPSWSIHTGVGSASYSFIWSMAGENQEFDDMDAVPTATLR